MILIISNTTDLTPDFVVRELNRRNIPFYRLNTDEFPLSGRGTVRLGYNNDRTKLIDWDNRTRPLDFNDVTSVLYRRPVPPKIDETISDNGIRKFCVDESYEFLRGIWHSLDAFWISGPEAIRKAEHKIYQLTVAEQLGFRVPRTVITNDPEQVLELYESSKSGVIVKPLYVGYVEEGKEPKNIFTTTIQSTDLSKIELVRYAPSIYQERISKRSDLRVTIVGDKIFAVRIIAKELPESMPDWRVVAVDSLEYEELKLPDEIAQKCLELVERLNLQFGAIDFGVDEEGQIVFFEINPNGQWAWLEAAVNVPISVAIVDRLVKG